MEQVCLSRVHQALQGRLDQLGPKENQESQHPLTLVHRDRLELQEVVDLKENQENQEYQISCRVQWVLGDGKVSKD